MYPDLVWQKSRDDLLGIDKSNGIYSNVLPYNPSIVSNEPPSGERHYQNILSGIIV